MRMNDPKVGSQYDRENDRFTLLSAQDLAGMMRVSTRTVWRLLSGGKLPQPIRIGGSVRWRRPDVEDWVRAGCPEQR